MQNKKIKSKYKLLIGAVIDEPGSSVKNKTGGWRTFIPIIDQEKCIKCGICWMDCPDMAIKKAVDGKFVIDYAFCKGCGICAKQCPTKVISMKLEEK